MEDALHDIQSMRQFAKLRAGRVPDETTILNFRHLLEKHNIAEEMFEGVDLHTGLVHTVVGTAANVADVTQAANLLHGQEEMVLGDAGYQGVSKREEHKDRQVQWHIALRPSLRREVGRAAQSLRASYEHSLASLRARVEHPFQIIKRLVGYTKVRYRGLAKNTAQLKTLFALSNLWMARRHLMAMMGEVRP